MSIASNVVDDCAVVFDRESAQEILDNKNKDGKAKVQNTRFYCALTDIYANPAHNMRMLDSAQYSEEAVGELANSIESLGGLINPINVTIIKPTEATDYRQFGLQSGYRRIMALEALAKRTGDDKWIMKIPCELSNAVSHAAFQCGQLAENTARADCTPLEIALQVQRIRSESSCKDLTDEQMAAIAGISAATLKRYLKLLDLPESVQALVNTGKLPLTSATLLVSDNYNIDESDIGRLATIGCKYSVQAFTDLLNDRYQKDADEDGKATSTTAKKPVNRISAAKLESVYMPYLKLRLAEIEKKAADEALPAQYTELDLKRAQAEVIESILGAANTEFVQEVKPFEDAKEEEAKKKKDSTKAEKSYAKWIATMARKTKQLMDMPESEDGNRPFPNRASALKQVYSNIKSMTQADIEKLGFDLDLTDEGALTKVFQEINNKYADNRKQAKVRAATAKAKKEAEAKAKDAAEKAAAK